MKQIHRAGKISVWRIGVEVEDGRDVYNNPKTRLPDAEYEKLSRQRLPYYLAAFLIGAQPQSYFQYGWGWGLKTGPLVQHPEFAKPLGAPRGDFVRPDPKGWIFQREFEHASVRVDLNAREGKIVWK